MQCPVCEDGTLGREHAWASFESHLSAMSPSYDSLALSPSRARVCESCGYLALFLSAEDRAKLKKHMTR